VWERLEQYELRRLARHMRGRRPGAGAPPVLHDPARAGVHARLACEPSAVVGRSLRGIRGQHPDDAA